MNAASSKHIMIIGSGFGGSILAAILAKAGIRVMLVDHQSHPRFAIGESSTPTANLIRSLEIPCCSNSSSLIS